MSQNFSHMQQKKKPEKGFRTFEKLKKLVSNWKLLNREFVREKTKEILRGYGFSLAGKIDREHTTKRRLRAAHERQADCCGSCEDENQTEDHVVLHVETSPRKWRFLFSITPSCELRFCTCLSLSVSRLSGMSLSSHIPGIGAKYPRRIGLGWSFLIIAKIKLKLW